MSRPSHSLSPGIYVNEIDKTLPPPVRPVTGPNGLIVSTFSKGPAEQLVPIRSLKALVETFGVPTEENKINWYYAKSIIDYGGVAMVWRMVKPSEELSAYRHLSPSSPLCIKNNADYQLKKSVLEAALSAANKNLGVVSRTPGSWGNSIVVAVDLPVQLVELTPHTHEVVVGNNLIETNYPNFLKNLKTVLLRDSTSPSTTYTATVIYANKGLTDTTVYVYYDGTSPSGVLDEIRLGSTWVTLDNYSSVTPTLPTSGSIVTNMDTGKSSYVINVNNGVYKLRHPVAGYFQALRFGTTYFAPTIKLDNRKIPYAKDTFGNEITWSSITSSATTYHGKFTGKIGDAISLVVIDRDGKISGKVGQILEIYSSLSVLSGAKNQYNGIINIFEVVNQRSQYIYMVENKSANFYGMDDTPTVFNTYNTDLVNYVAGVELTGGGDLSVDYDLSNFGVSLANDLDLIKYNYNQISGSEYYDIDYLVPYINYAAMMLSDGSAYDAEKYAYSDLINSLVDICETTKRSIVVVSPPGPEVIDNQNNVINSIAFRNNLYESSFCYYINEWLYMYDNYTGKFFWYPGAGEVAGILARNKKEYNSYLSPAGFNRGVLMNGIRLSNNTSKNERDTLYRHQINCIIASNGDGYVLFGDKTLLTYQSFFNRVNVREVIIEIHRNSRDILKNYIFGVNNEYTRSQVATELTSYLNRVLLGNGISDFRVVCDETNNTQDIIDNNEMVVDIEVRPTLSINYITLNITANRNLVQVTETLE